MIKTQIQEKDNELVKNMMSPIIWVLVGIGLSEFIRHCFGRRHRLRAKNQLKAPFQEAEGCLEYASTHCFSNTHAITSCMLAALEENVSKERTLDYLLHPPVHHSSGNALGRIPVVIIQLFCKPFDDGHSFALFYDQRKHLWWIAQSYESWFSLCWHGSIPLDEITHFTQCLHGVITNNSKRDKMVIQKFLGLTMIDLPTWYRLNYVSYGHTLPFPHLAYRILEGLE